jgi:hypothetical protein
MECMVIMIYHSLDRNTAMDMIPHDKILEQPILLRHPFIFYLGHIPAFLDLHLHRSLGIPLSHPTFSTLFERGMDPDVDDPSSCHEHSEGELFKIPLICLVPDHWPELIEVKEYSKKVQMKLSNLLKDSLSNSPAEVFWMAYEHQAMHLETIMYMLIQTEGILPPFAIAASIGTHCPLSLEQSLHIVSQKQQFYTSKAGMVDLGVDQGLVWDNERPKRTHSIASFKVCQLNVTNVEYYDFWRQHDSQKELFPAQWSLSNESAASGDNVWIKTLHGKVPLVEAALWPVFVSFELAEAYARWKNMRLLTELECRKLMNDRQDDLKGNDCLTVNIGFKSWTPKSVDFEIDPQVAPPLVGDAWEWTSSVFEPHEGFEPGKLYPNYSKDFL